MRIQINKQKKPAPSIFCIDDTGLTQYDFAYVTSQIKKGPLQRAVPMFQSRTESRLSDLYLLCLFLCLARTRKRDMKHTVIYLSLNLVFLHVVRQRQSLLVIAV